MRPRTTENCVTKIGSHKTNLAPHPTLYLHSGHRNRVTAKTRSRYVNRVHLFINLVTANSRERNTLNNRTGCINKMYYQNCKKSYNFYHEIRPQNRNNLPHREQKRQPFYREVRLHFFSGPTKQLVPRPPHCLGF
jgi:hypothetical protein